MELFTLCNVLQSYSGILAHLKAIYSLKTYSYTKIYFSCQLHADWMDIIQIYCKLFWDTFKLYWDKVNSQKHLLEIYNILN